MGLSLDSPAATVVVDIEIRVVEEDMLKRACKGCWIKSKKLIRWLVTNKMTKMDTKDTRILVSAVPCKIT